MLSQTAEYALRAVLFLAERGDEGPVRVAEIAAVLRIPQNYLSKIFHRLARAGVLTSVRGKTGGFQLAVPPDRLCVYPVIAPFDRFEQRRRCLLGRAECSDRSACAAHARWKEVGDTVTTFLRETTIAELTRGASVVA